LTYKKLPLPLSKPSAHGKHFMACLLFRQRPWNEVENVGWTGKLWRGSGDFRIYTHFLC